MPGGGADELAGFLGEQVGDGAGVRALDRLAGEDHGAGVDRVAFDPCIRVCAADEAREFFDVDGVVRQIGRQQDRRLPQELAADHDEPARQRGAEPLQMNAREHQVRGRRADVDADGGQFHIIGGPRHLVERPFARVDVQVFEFKVVHGHALQRSPHPSPACGGEGRERSERGGG